MSIKFNAGAPKEGEFILLPPGEYDFEITGARETTTDKAGPKLAMGTPKLELKLRVDGRATVFDNLFFAESTYWKVDAFLASVGLHPGEGELVEIDAADLIGIAGRCRLLKKKDNSGNDRNEVGGYLFDKDAPPKKRTALDSVKDAQREQRKATTALGTPITEGVEDDDIPF